MESLKLMTSGIQGAFAKYINKLDFSYLNELKASFVKKVLFKENSLLRIGYPFIIKNSYVENADIIVENERNAKLFASNVNICLKYDDSRIMNESLNDIEFTLDITVENISITVIFSDKHTITFKTDKLVYDSTNNLIHMIKNGVFIENKCIFEIDELSLSVIEEHVIEIQIENLNIETEKFGFNQLIDFFDSFSLKGVAFRIKCKEIHFKYSTSSTINLKSFFINLSNGAELICEEIMVKLSSISIIINGVMVSHDQLQVNHFVVKNMLRKTIMESDDSGKAIYREEKSRCLTIIFSPIFINACLYEVSMILEVISTNSFFSSFYSYLLDLSQIVVHFNKVSLQISVSKQCIAQAISEITFSHEKESTEISLKDFCFSINDFPMVFSKLVCGISIIRRSDDILAQIYFSDPELFISYFELKELLLISPVFVSIIHKLLGLNCYRLSLSLKKAVIHLCLFDSNKQKEPIADAIMNSINFSFNTIDSPFSWKGNSDISLRVFNPLTSFWDYVIEPFSITLEPKMSKISDFFSLIVGSEININFSKNIIETLSMFFDESFVFTKYMYCIVNESYGPMQIIYDNEKKIQLDSFQSIKIENPIIKLNIANKFIQYSLKLITKPIFISDELLLSPNIAENSRIIRITNRNIIENQLDTDIIFSSKQIFRYQEILRLSPGSRMPLIPGFSFSESYILTGCEQHNNKIKPIQIDRNSNQFIPMQIYTLNDEISALMQNYTDTLTMTRIISIMPRYQLKSYLKSAVSLAIIGSKQVYFNEISPLFVKRFSINPDVYGNISIYVFNGTHRSATVQFSLKNPKQKETCDLPLVGRISILMNITQKEEIVFSLIEELSILNSTMYKILLYHNDSYIPINKQQYISINPDNSKQLILSLDGSSERTEINHKFSFYNWSSVIFLKKKKNNYPFRLKFHDDQLCKTIEILPMLYITNNLPSIITLLSGVHDRQAFVTGQSTVLQICNDDMSFTIEYEEYCPVNNISFSHPYSTCIQFIDEDRRIFVNLDIFEKDYSYYIVFSELSFPPRYMISNCLESHIVYAQQIEKYLPLTIKPMSSSVFGFDIPFESLSIVITIEGRSHLVPFYTSFCSSSLIFRTNGVWINVSVETLDNGCHLMIIKKRNDKTNIHRLIKIGIPSIKCIFMVTPTRQILQGIIKGINYIFNSSTPSLLSKFSIDSICIEDLTRTLSSKVIMRYDYDSIFPFLKLHCEHDSNSLSISHIKGSSLCIQNIELVINETILDSFSNLFSSLSSFQVPRLLQLIPLSLDSIFFSPFSIALLIENTNKSKNKSEISFLSKLSLPQFFIVRLPGFDIRNTFGTFSTLQYLVSKLFDSIVSTVANRILNQDYYYVFNQLSTHFLGKICIINDSKKNSTAEMGLQVYTDDVRIPIFSYQDKSVALESSYNLQPIFDSILIKSYNEGTMKDGMAEYGFSVQTLKKSINRRKFPFDTIDRIEVQKQAQKFVNRNSKRGALKVSFNATNLLYSVFEKCIVMTDTEDKEFMFSIIDHFESRDNTLTIFMQTSKSKHKSYVLMFESPEKAEIARNLSMSQLYQQY